MMGGQLPVRSVVFMSETPHGMPPSLSRKGNFVTKSGRFIKNPFSLAENPPLQPGTGRKGLRYVAQPWLLVAGKMEPRREAGGPRSPAVGTRSVPSVGLRVACRASSGMECCLGGWHTD